MSLEIKLTMGSSAIEFFGNETWVLDYTPNTPDLTTVDFTPEALMDGGERLYASRRNVTESMVVSIGGSSKGALQDNINKIESWFRRAEEYQTRRTGSPVYINVKPDGLSENSRSELLDGKLMLGDAALSYEWRNRRVTATLAWTRRYYWEGEEVSLDIENMHAGGSTNTLINGGSSGELNWAYIRAGQTKGSIPCEPYVMLRNTTPVTVSTARIANIHLGIGVNDFVKSGIGLNFLAASADYKVSGSPYGVYGYYQDYSASNGWTTLYKWDIADDHAEAYGGNFFRAMLTMSAFVSSASAKMRLSFRIPLGTDITTTWTSPEYTISNSAFSLHDLGSIPIPPWGKSAGFSAGGRICLEVKRSADFRPIVGRLTLMPIDSWRTYNAPHYYMPLDSTLHDDSRGHVALVYPILDEDDGPTGLLAGYGFYTATGQPLRLWPNVEHLIYMIVDSDTGGIVDSHQISASFFYRPRRLTI